MNAASDSFLCIDLKSFYASVECVRRGLNPLTAKLVVADESRTDKTICLAVSPALKAYGISGRARLFEVKQRLQEVKAATGEEVSFLVARPQMADYLAVSAKIYATYLNYLSPDDIHVYSVDEVFMDLSKYLTLYRTTSHELAVTIIRAVFRATGITATAGIGSNLYLAKIAMDIVAKRAPPDRDGVRLAELDEIGYRQLLWNHRPLTDFWRVGHGTCKRLQRIGVRTMGDLARLSLQGEELLFQQFGVDAELLIDHAWGVESCTMRDIKTYHPSTHSVSSGQVLQKPYSFAQARLIVWEMAEQMALSLAEQGLVTEAIVLHVGYDRERVENGAYRGAVKIDHYGRKIPRSAHGTADLGSATCLISRITQGVLTLYDEIVDPTLTVRRLNLSAIRLEEESKLVQQYDLFTDHTKLEKERRLQQAILAIHRRYGKNAILKGHDLLDCATAIQRNHQIGGHRA
jgi:DNA polymerase V